MVFLCRSTDPNDAPRSQQFSFVCTGEGLAFCESKNCLFWPFIGFVKLFYSSVRQKASLITCRELKPEKGTSKREELPELASNLLGNSVEQVKCGRSGVAPLQPVACPHFPKYCLLYGVNGEETSVDN